MTDCLMLFLYVTPVCLAILYGFLKYGGYLDKWTGRSKSLEGLKRLSIPTGYPDGWIFNDQKDSEVFAELEKRISKRSNSKELSNYLESDIKPSCIAIGGQPTAIQGVQPDWPQECRYGYLPTASVMYLFNVHRDENSKGKAIWVCNLNELQRWLDEERERRKFYLGVLVLGVISLIFILIRSPS